MSVPKKIINFLEKNKAKYEILKHRKVYTSFDKAKTLRVKPNLIGKTLILKAKSDIFVVLIPADKNLDRQKFKKIINKERKKAEKKAIQKIEFASERIIKNKIKGIKLGAIPPFGSLFGFPTFINKSFLKQPKIIISSGDYKNSIIIKSSFLKKMIPDLVIGSFVKAKK